MAAANKPRIVFMGTPGYAQTILESIIDQTVLVVTRPDKPVGRKREITPPPVKVTAQKHGIDVLQPERLDNSYIDTIKGYDPDFLIVAAYGQILSREILDIATPINLHASLLPRYRGASPVQECLLNNDSYTGVTAMLMEEGLDSGPILGYRAFKIAQETTLQDLMGSLAAVAADLTTAVIESYDRIRPLTQEGALKSYCKKVKSGDGEVDFAGAQKLFNKYRAYFGWPGIHLQSGLKLKELSLIETRSQNTPGAILEKKQSGLVVGCGRGSVLITRVQPPSKKPMDAISYANGKRLDVADTLL